MPDVLHLVQRHGHSAVLVSGIRTAGVVLLLGHLLVVGLLTLRPRSVAWVSPGNLHPFASIRADLEAGPGAALEGIGGELLLLAPLGLLLPLIAWRLQRGLLRTSMQMTLAGTLISLVLALLQTGVPGHVVNVDTVILNAAGVALAHVLLYPALRSCLRRTAAGTGKAGAEPGKNAGRAAAQKTGRKGGDRKGAGSGEQQQVGLREESQKGATPRPSRVGIAP
ncbi:VanZ family protein [Streptomyces sp. N2-109]|uniref:VanZ family protein n=1 Tax=Streptomyces gossypii TaxID=2883101 RepID=A0ABT2K2T5_9ACTN|nr:VanZ family protein [Streptomyces gossypii]MCT2594458.1 VanZ family protein [Streptomyces gossypii]